MPPRLSVIIPAYNEEQRLPPTLQAIHAYLSGRQIPFEILIVNDGSIDQTMEVVQDFASHHDGIRLITYSPNQGKGHAVRTGVMAAEGELLLLDDADGSSPIEEVERLEQAILEHGADIAIGSRNKPDDGTTIEALAYRKHIGNTFNFFVQSLLLPGIFDTQCGFKLFKRPIARDLFQVSRQNGFAFDVEVLFIARLRGYKIEERGINWHNVDGSKVNVLTDSPRMLLQVAGIAVSAWLGKYRKLKKNSLPV